MKLTISNTKKTCEFDLYRTEHVFLHTDCFTFFLITPYLYLIAYCIEVHIIHLKILSCVLRSPGVFRHLN